MLQLGELSGTPIQKSLEGYHTWKIIYLTGLLHLNQTKIKIFQRMSQQRLQQTLGQFWWASKSSQTKINLRGEFSNSNI